MLETKNSNVSESKIKFKDMSSDERKEAISGAVRNWSTVLLTICVSVIYVFYGLVNITSSGRSIIDIIIVSFASLVMGVLLNSLLGERGIQMGLNSKTFISEKTKYEIESGKAEQYFDVIDIYEETENTKLLIRVRRSILRKAGLNYDKVFLSNGDIVYPEFEIIDSNHNKDNLSNKAIAKENKINKKIYQRKVKAIDRAVKIEINPINMTSLVSIEKEATQKEASVGKLRAKTISVSAISKIVFAVVAGSVGATWGGFDLGTLIWSLCQIIVWLMFAVIKLYSNYDYIVNKFSQVYKRKTNYIIAFKNVMDKSYAEWKIRADKEYLVANSDNIVNYDKNEIIQIESKEESEEHKNEKESERDI